MSSILIRCPIILALSLTKEMTTLSVVYLFSNVGMQIFY